MKKKKYTGWLRVCLYHKCDEKVFCYQRQRRFHYHEGVIRFRKPTCKEIKERKIISRKNQAISVTGSNNSFYGKFGKNSHVFGLKRSKKTKRKLSVANSGKNNAMYGRRGKLNPMYGYRHTDKIKKRLSIVMQRRWANGDLDGVNFRSKKTQFYRKDLHCLFRSKWEANFARILKYLWEDYAYEEYTFLTPFGRYTPDFYLTEKQVFVEIKGYEDNDSIQKKKRKYIRMYYGIVICLVRGVAYDKLKRKYKSKIPNWES